MLPVILNGLGILSSVGTGLAYALSTRGDKKKTYPPASNLQAIGNRNFQILKFVEVLNNLIVQMSKGDWKPSTNSSPLWYSRFSNRYGSWPACQQLTWRYGDPPVTGLITNRGTWVDGTQKLLVWVTIKTVQDLGFSTDQLTFTDAANIVNNVVKQSGQWDKWGGGIKDQTCLASWINGWDIPVVSSVLSMVANYIGGIFKNVSSTANALTSSLGKDGNSTFADVNTIVEIASLAA